MCKEEEVKEPASPGARLMQAPGFDLCILAVFGYKTKIDLDLFKEEIGQTLARHPRFCSLLIAKNKMFGTFSWQRTKIDLNKHIIAPKIDPGVENPDDFIDDYISSLSKSQMTHDKPLWEVHVLNVKNSDANSTVVFKIDHSIGDGVSLISLVMACARKKPESQYLPPVANKKAREEKVDAKNGLMKRLFVSVWTLILLLFNTLVDLLLFLATLMFLKDTKTVIKASGNVELCPRRFVRRVISLDDVKLVKNAMNVSINDVVLGVTEAGLTSYLNRRYEKHDENGTKITKKGSDSLPKNIRLRSACIFNLRPCAKLENLAEMMEKEKLLKGMWGNLVGIVVLPLTIALESDPLAHIRRAKSTMDKKKLSLGHKVAFGAMKLMMFLFGSKVAAGVSTRVFRNTTLSFSNVVGPREEINVFGHPLAYIAPSVFGYPQGLVIHYQSYADRLVIVLAADEALYPNPRQLCDDLVRSFETMKEAVKEKGLC
ncbi:O-acyltransferase (WSD1-like) family protein [Striga hermonthica]|uniref:O-acyltransferase (WSD1-like) family protein n=1 Tax=Striga hermonthica TaxID=68872 RepID=A0A9N7R367_STRHE|nr:O-acyltransferase (WSD1-like) family protein [Striga hermonthica]